MPNAIDELVESCRMGQCPRLVARMKSGWAVMGEIQVLTGYCLLLPDPVVPDLNSLTGENRMYYLRDMTLLGDAILRVTDAIRINYEILGNLEPALHAHAIPRYADEEEPLNTQPIWMYDWEEAPRFSIDDHGDLMVQIRESIHGQQGLDHRIHH